MSVTEQAAVPAPIRSEEGAISMAVNPGADNMTFEVSVLSFTPAYVQKDETGGHIAMTQDTAPARPDPGAYSATVVFDSVGPHEIICFNGSTRVRESVFAGEHAAYDPRKIQMTAGQIAQNERAKAARIAGTKGLIG